MYVKYYAYSISEKIGNVEYIKKIIEIIKEHYVKES